LDVLDRSLASDVGDLRAGDAKISQFAAGQTGKLTIGLLILLVGAELLDDVVKHFLCPFFRERVFVTIIGAVEGRSSLSTRTEISQAGMRR